MNARTATNSTAAPRRLAVGLAAVATLVLAACSGSATPVPPAASPTGGQSIAGATDGGGGLTAGVVDVCGIVTAADVAALYTGPATAKVEPGLAGETSGCDYIATQFPDDESVSIQVVSGDQASFFWAGNIPPQGDDDIPLTGIGDQAMRAAGSPDLVSIKGTVFCEVEAGSGNTEIYADLATPDASDNLPDDAATAFAEKLGALCNKIFAGQ